MKIINEYLAYIKDNPQGYWFKRKMFGWGWTPAKWQGWAVLAVYVVLVIGFGLTIDERSPRQEVMFTFVLPCLFLTITLIAVCYKTGEKPKWMWRVANKDSEKKDF